MSNSPGDHTRSGYPVDVQLMWPGGPVRSSVILEEAHLLLSYHVKFPFTQETQSSLNWFQRLITLSQKKYFRRSSLQRCLTSLTEWPLVADRVLLSKSDSNFGLDFSVNILNISSKSALFLFSSNVQRPSCFSLSLYGNSFIPGTRYHSCKSML